MGRKENSNKNSAPYSSFKSSSKGGNRKSPNDPSSILFLVRCFVATCALVNAGLFYHLLRQSNGFLISQLKNQFTNFARSQFGESAESIFNLMSSQPEGRDGLDPKLAQLQYWDNSSNLTVVTSTFHKVVSFPDESSYKQDDQQHDARSPVVFILGYPRSGVTLTRMILDAHPLVNCGGDTKAVGNIMDFSQNFFFNKIQRAAIENAGINENTMLAANRAFLLEIMARQNNPARVLCNRDGNMARHMDALSKMFPNAKFVFLIRDPRAAIKSMMSRNMTMPGLDPTNMTMPFVVWEEFHNSTLTKCWRLGKSRCHMLFYERLVSFPEFEVRHLTSFLGLPWSEQVMRHQDFVGDAIPFPKAEFNIDTISQPIFTTSVRDFKNYFPRSIRQKLKRIAPHMQMLGYERKSDFTNFWELGNVNCSSLRFQDVIPWVDLKNKPRTT